MSEKLCLQWNDFKDVVNTAFGNLRGDTDFIDVTLACEDGRQLKAHKAQWPKRVKNEKKFTGSKIGAIFCKITPRITTQSLKIGP